MKGQAAPSGQTDDFEQFSALYDLIHAMDPSKVSTRHLESVPIDSEAQGILDDVESLLTIDPAVQPKTRQILRNAISKAAAATLEYRS